MASTTFWTDLSEGFHGQYGEKGNIELRVNTKFRLIGDREGAGGPAVQGLPAQRFAPDCQESLLAKHAIDMDRLIHRCDGVFRYDNHLGTGFLATPDLLPTLADIGEADLAYQVLTQRSWPSWLRMRDLNIRLRITYRR